MLLSRRTTLKQYLDMSILRRIFALMDRTRTLTLYALCSILIGGCSLFGRGAREAAPGPPYPPFTGVLDENYFHSPAGDVAARYPSRWLHVDIRTIPMENVLEVYTDGDRERALVLSEIPATAEFRRMVERDGMPALAEESFRVKSAKVPGKLTIIRPADLYTIGSKLFVSYDYADAGVDSLHRKETSAVLFTTGARFYEVAMVELVAPAEVSQHNSNFRLLQSVIASLEGAAEVRQSVDDRSSTVDTTSF